MFLSLNEINKNGKIFNGLFSKKCWGLVWDVWMYLCSWGYGPSVQKILKQNIKSKNLCSGAKIYSRAVRRQTKEKSIIFKTKSSSKNCGSIKSFTFVLAPCAREISKETLNKSVAWKLQQNFLSTWTRRQLQTFLFVFLAMKFLWKSWLSLENNRFNLVECMAIAWC